MALNTTDAIVLRRYLFRETSLIISCLTATHGHIKGVIKGIRGSSNRYRSAMEAITANRIVFYDSHNSQLHLISQCELFQTWSNIQQDYEVSKVAAFCVDLADTVLPLDEPQLEIYELLFETLTRLNLQELDPYDISLHFVARLLRIIGFTPQVDGCTGCGNSATTGAFWSARQGGLLCRQCRHHDPMGKLADPVLVNCLGALSESQNPIELTHKIRMPLRSKVEEFLSFRLDRPLRTQNILHAG